MKIRSSPTRIGYANIYNARHDISTYDHFSMKTFDPVCSRKNKHGRGGLVLRWVTTGESPLLYVFSFCTRVLLKPLYVHLVLLMGTLHP
jgi:hypothetical protein